MTPQGFRYEPFYWREQAEWMLNLGPGNGPQALIIPPLFEEMNFTRTFTVDMMRGLATEGIGSWLADLPGTGESLHDLSDMSWEDWRGAIVTVGRTITALSGALPHVIALRGGVLLADALEARSWWTFAPAPGATLLRHLQRTQIIADRDRDIPEPSDKNRISFLAGYPVSAELLAGLTDAEVPALPAPHREAPAESLDDRARLWRRAEPGSDPELASKLAGDIAAWIATCEPR